MSPDGGTHFCDDGRDAGFEFNPAETALSLEGTAFEALSVSWAAPLELCSRWSGHSREEELRNKVHVTLGPVQRAGLSAEHLAGAALSGGVLRDGPLAAAHRRWPTSTTRLTRHRLLRASGAMALQVELRHAITGGELVEVLDILRAEGEDRAVVIADEREHRFEFLPDGRSAPIPLAPGSW